MRLCLFKANFPKLTIYKCYISTAEIIQRQSQQLQTHKLMHRSINLAFATIALIATITGYISLIPNIARSQQPTPKTCNRATKEGYPFPSSSGYVSGYQVKAKTGLSTVRFDNSQGNFDLFIKLFTLSSERPQTIRAFLVKQAQPQA